MNRQIVLAMEMATLGKGPAETSQDIISPDGRLGRIHLRTYVAASGDPDKLHRAFVETANTYPASPDKLAKFCNCLGDLATAGGIPFAREAVLAYFGKIARDGYPAIHHSETFHQAYRPAYRVVAVDLLQ